MVKNLSIRRRLQFNLLALNLKLLPGKQDLVHKVITLMISQKKNQTTDAAQGKTKTTESKAPYISVSGAKKVQTEDNVARQ
jgi:hypothetical protein